MLQSNLFELARAMWSMPPDHGAAVVRLILESDTLTAAWHSELGDMRERINAIRAALSSADRGLSFIANQRGLFAMLPLSPEQVQRLRHEHGIYMAPSGRANLAGLTIQDIPRFVSAMQSVM